MTALVAEVIMKAVDQLSAPLGKMAQGILNFNTKFQALGELATKAGRAMSLSFTAPAALMIKSFVDTEAALNSLKTVWGGTNEQFEAASKQIEAFTEKLPYTTEEIAGVYQSMAEANVPAKEMADTFKIVSDAAMATGGDLNTTASFLIHMKQQLKLSNDAMKDLGLSLNTLNLKPETLQGLEEVMGKTSALYEHIGGKQAVVAAESFAGVMLKIGAAPSQAALALGQFSKAITSVKPSNDVVTAFADIGMSMKEVQHGMKHDAAATLLKIFERIGKLNPGEQVQAFRALFGSMKGGANAAAALANNLPQVTNYLAQFADKGAEAAKQQQDIKDKQDTLGASMSEFGHTLTNFGDAIAKHWVKPIRWANETFGGWLDTIKASPTTMSLISDSFGVLALLGPGLLGFGYGVRFISGAFTGLALAFKGAQLGLTFLCNPATLLALAAIAVVGFAIYEAYENWDTIGPKVKDFAKSLEPLGNKVMQDALQFLKDLAATAKDVATAFKDPSMANIGKAIGIGPASGAPKDMGPVGVGSDIAGWMNQDYSSFAKPSGPGSAGALADIAMPSTMGIVHAFQSLWDSMSGGGGAPSAEPSGGQLLREGPVDVTGKVTAEVQGQATVNVNIMPDPSLRVGGMTATDDGRNIRANVGTAMPDTGVKP